MGYTTTSELGASPAAMRARVPVLIIAWNRPHLLKSVLKEIIIYSPPKIYLHIDGPPRSAERERVIELQNEILNVFREETRHFPAEVLVRQVNLGCGYGPLAAINWFLENEREGIIVEDDIQISLEGLELLTLAIDMFRNDDAIASVSACNIVDGRQTPREENQAFVRSFISNSSGWATWSDRWAGHIHEASELLWKAKWLRIARLLGATATAIIFYWIAREAWRQSRGTSTMWDAQWMVSSLSNKREFVVSNYNQVVNLDLYGGTHPLPVRLVLSHESVPDNLGLNPNYSAARDKEILTYYLRFNAQGLLLRLRGHLGQISPSAFVKKVRGG